MKRRHVHRSSKGVQRGHASFPSSPRPFAAKRQVLAAPLGRLTTEEFEALMAVAAGQDPSLVWAH